MPKKLAKILIIAFLILSFFAFKKPVFAQAPIGANVTDHIAEWDRAAEAVGPGGWITIMPKLGNAKDIQNFLDKHPETNVVIRIHYPDTVPDENSAVSWTATLGNLDTGGRKIYIMPWNEPNMERETGGVGNTLDPNDTAAVPMLRAYTETLMTNLKEAGLLGTKVGVLSPMINQSAPNYTAFMKALGREYFQQFDGISMNLYNYSRGCPKDDPLCNPNPFLNASKYREILGMFGLENMPVFGLEAGIVDESGTCPATVTDCPIFEAEAMNHYMRAMYEIFKNDPNFVMISPLSYNPEIANKNPWLWGSIVEQFMRETNLSGEVMKGKFDEEKFKKWLEDKIKKGLLVSCGELGFATSLEICNAVALLPFILPPPPAPPPLVCENPNAEEGVFRPEPCVGCGDTIDSKYLELTCATTLEARQNAAVAVNIDAYENGDKQIGDITLCEEGEPYAYFTQSWGGKVSLDISESKVPFAGYHDYLKTKDNESLYLLRYLTGSNTGEHTPDCDPEDSDPQKAQECVRKIFKEGGVLPKILPKEELDRLRCTRIRKAFNGSDLDYEAGGKNLSDFYNYDASGRADVHLEKITSGVKLNSPWCTEPSLRSFPPAEASSEVWQEYQKFVEEYLEEHRIWENKLKDWLKTDLADAWQYIPLTTMKDAPGTMQIVPTYKESQFALDSGGTTVNLAIPHMAGLHEAAEELHKALTPKYQESSLAPVQSKQEEKTLLASAIGSTPGVDKETPGVDEYLDQLLDQSQSACGYQQVLGEKTTLLAQGPSSEGENPFVGLDGYVDYDPVKGTFTFKVEISNKDAYGFHIETLNFNINGQNYAYRPGTYTVVDTTLSVSNQDLGLESIPLKKGETVKIDITLISKDADRVHEDNPLQVFILEGYFTLDEEGNLQTNWEKTSLTGPEYESRKKQAKTCYNKINETPFDCYDPNALTDTNPNDPICSNPFPITGQLLNTDYRTPVSQEQLAILIDDTDKCIRKANCMNKPESPKDEEIESRESCINHCQQRWTRSLKIQAEVVKLLQKATSFTSLTPEEAEEALKPYRYDLKYQSDFYMTAPLQIKLYLPYTETVGHNLISNYYRYAEPPEAKGKFEVNEFAQPQDQIGGVFDIFRPAQMEHFEPLEAKTNIGYSYQGTYSQYFNSPKASWRGLSKVATADSFASPSTGEIYFPWLGGVNQAKKCVSEGILLPNELAKSQYCPGFEGKRPSPFQDIFPYEEIEGCPTLDYKIDLKDISTKKILEKRRSSIISFVNGNFGEENQLEENWDELVNRSLAEGVNPAFVMALYIEESGGSMPGINDAFGCLPDVPKNFQQSLNCLFEKSVCMKEYKDDFESCMLSYSSLDDKDEGCFRTNPNFPGNIKYVYQILTGESL